MLSFGISFLFGLLTGAFLVVVTAMCMIDNDDREE